MWYLCMSKKNNLLLAKWIGYVYNSKAMNTFLFQDCAILLVSNWNCLWVVFLNIAWRPSLHLSTKAFLLTKIQELRLAVDFSCGCTWKLHSQGLKTFLETNLLSPSVVFCQKLNKESSIWNISLSAGGIDVQNLGCAKWPENNFVWQVTMRQPCVHCGWNHTVKEIIWIIFFNLVTRNRVLNLTVNDYERRIVL